LIIVERIDRRADRREPLPALLAEDVEAATATG
jgi:hypothetical protein